jgi:2-polyprenyl-3-methyl-5-hydroxy-6-metoxy-1,4-benzoquinol methylase
MITPKPTATAETYYQADRLEMMKLLPSTTMRVLELGCGLGGFGAAVKKQRGAEYWAIEYNPEVAEFAGRVLDRVLVGDADQLIPGLPDDYFDAVVCNDVLEHLSYPGKTLERLRPKLRAKGVVVSSIPNIRYLPALSRIVFQRDFPAEDEGIFDRTHLRFFTRKSIRRMFDEAGYEMQSMKGINMANPLSVTLALVSLGYFWDGVWMQYACVASPRA